MRYTLLSLLFVATIAQGAPKKLQVSIVNRQSSDTQYAYAVPGYSSTNCSAVAYAGTATGSCYGSSSPGMVGSYHVTGATLSLLLPDGRIVVANCNSKLNMNDWSTTNMRRSCREPITDDVQAEFNGDSAKLEWSVSIDGKKKQRETYKIIGILTKNAE